MADAPTADRGILSSHPLDTNPAEVPPVVLSKQHADTCLVNVGDTMPDVRLPDLNGTEQDLAKMLGDRLTVLFFWTSDNRHAVAEVRDLAAKVASPLAPLGVRVVGACERDMAADAAKISPHKERRFRAHRRRRLVLRASGHGQNAANLLAGPVWQDPVVRHRIHAADPPRLSRRSLSSAAAAGAGDAVINAPFPDRGL